MKAEPYVESPTMIATKMDLLVITHHTVIDKNRFFQSSQ